MGFDCGGVVCGLFFVGWVRVFEGGRKGFVVFGFVLGFRFGCFVCWGCMCLCKFLWEGRW